MSVTGHLIMSPGVVYLTRYLGDKMPPFYIGSSSEQRIVDGYHGTVKSKRYAEIWQREIEAHPELFITEIVSRHASRKEATIAERQLQQELGVVGSDLFINMSIAAPNGFFGPSQRGIPKTAEHAAKISRSLVGRTFSATHRFNASAAQKRKAPPSEQTCKALGRASQGANNARALTFVVTSPDGKSFTVTGGLRDFCRQHGLSMSRMFRHIGQGRIATVNKGPQTSASRACDGWEIQRT
jgi:hypothetical protein